MALRSLRRLSLYSCACFVLALLCLTLAPAHAGSWQFTITGSGTNTTSPHQTIPDWSAPNPQNGSTGYSASTGSGIGPGQSASFSATADVTFHVSVAWVPTGTLAQDPAPTTLRVTETGTPTWSATGSNINSDGTSTPVTGTGSATLTGFSAGTHQYTMPGGFSSRDITFHGTANLTVSAAAGTHGTGGSVSTGFTYSISAGSISATLTVDQDQQVFTPAATTRLSATASFPAGFTIDSMKISVDGTPMTATVAAGSSSGYINWPQSGGNPSEHTVTATAQIHDSVGTLSLDSTNPPGRAYQVSGMGRPADDIVADLKLKSLKFNSSIALAQDASTNISSPEFTWTTGSLTPATANPVAYVQGSKPNWTLTLASSSGAALTRSATMGYLLKATATPNTTNPSTNQADPSLTLYDNTIGSPAVPTALTSPLTLAATTALSSWVSTYTESFSTVTFYVKFTKIPTPVWRAVSSYGGSSAPGNTLYAVLATPTAPMAKPWVGVLSYACNWAKRTSDATSATTVLATGLYISGTYNGGFEQDTNQTTSPETFYLKDFAYYNFATGTAALYGQCNDFSDFLVCASNAIGAKSLQSQRIGGPFQTNPITASPEPNFTLAGSRGWSYHQFTGISTFFDGCLRFQALTTPANLALSAYESGLIAPGYSAVTLPLFTPIIKNSRSNP